MREANGTLGRQIRQISVAVGDEQLCDVKMLLPFRERMIFSSDPMVSASPAP